MENKATAFKSINELVVTGQYDAAYSLTTQAIEHYQGTSLVESLTGKLKYLESKLKILGKSIEIDAKVQQKKILKAKFHALDKLRICCAIVNHNCTENANLLAQRFSNSFDTIIIDSGSDIAPDGAIRCGNIYYSGLLNVSFNFAVDEGYEWLFFICSDVQFEQDQLDIMVNRLNTIDLDEIGVYAPSSEGRSHIFCKKECGRGLKAVPFVEGFIFMARLNVLKHFAPIDLEVNKYGHGLDVAAGFYARHLSLLCVIDEEVSVFHPGETGYSNEQAGIAMDAWFDSHTATPLQDFVQYGVVTYLKYWSNTKITVVIPCYNHGRYLHEAVISVLLQYYSNVEIIIVDDGSTDSTESISTALALQYSQVIYIKKQNGGLSSSRNAALRVATGQFIQFLDADDFISKNKFIDQIYEMKNKKSDISYSEYLCFHDPDKDNTFTYSRLKFADDPLLDLIDNWETDLSIPMHCFLFHAEVLKGLFFEESMPNHEDWDFHLRVALRSPKYSYCAPATAYYRVRKDSMCRDKDLMLYGLRLCMERAIDSGCLSEKYLIHMHARLRKEQTAYIQLMLERNKNVQN